MDRHITQEKNFLPAQNVTNYLAGNPFLGLRTKKNHQDILSLILILNNQLEEY